jgi:hypothetical protein
MLYTDDEARRKICPQGRSRIWVPATEIHQATILSADQHCSGSNCMAWKVVVEADLEQDSRGRCRLIPQTLDETIAGDVQ